MATKNSRKGVAKGRPKQPDQQTGLITVAETLASALLPAGGGVTRERSKTCGEIVDRWMNTMDEPAKAEITIESLTLACNKLELYVDGESEPKLKWVGTVSEPEGPHKVKVPANKTLILNCRGQEKGQCNVKYTFRWQ